MSEFRPIPKYPGYLINCHGDVRSLKTDCILKLWNKKYVTLLNKEGKKGINVYEMAKFIFSDENTPKQNRIIRFIKKLLQKKQ